MIYPVLFWHSYKFLNLHIKELGYPEKGVETWLNCVSAPFGDCGGVFTELFGKPFVGPLLLHKHDFDSVYIFAHDVLSYSLMQS